MDTSIRIEVPAAIYNQLVRIQENRRQAEGRKPSLSSIILDFCSSCINDEQTSSKNVQSAGNSVQNNAADVQNTRLFQSEENMQKRLTRWEDSLLRWETNLNIRESRLRESLHDFAEQREEIHQARLQMLEEEEELPRKKPLAGPEEIIENKMMSVEIKDKNEKIKKLKETINILEEDLEKAQSAAKPLKEPSSFLSIIKEYWPLILAGAGLLFTYFKNQKSESKKQNELMGKLLESLGKIDSGDKEKLVKKLMDGVKNAEGLNKDSFCRKDDHNSESS